MSMNSRTSGQTGGIVEVGGRGQSSRGCHSSEDTHICEKCCAEFFTWTELSQHHAVCTEDPLVLIVKDSEVHQESSAGTSPVPSVASSVSSPEESTDVCFDVGEMPANDGSSDNVEESPEADEAMEVERHPVETYDSTASPRLPDSAQSTFPQTPAADSYSVPSTNVTLEILHSTRVAVAQFSQGIHGSGSGGKSASAAIPVILEHLLALQQQQVHQLQLIEQICSQVAVMNRHPTQAALNPVSRSLSLAPNPFPSQSVAPPPPPPPPILPLSGTMPSSVNGQAAVSMPSVVERSQSVPSKSVCETSSCRDVTRTSASSELSAPSLPRGGGGGGSIVSHMSSLLPPYTASQNTPTLSSPSSSLSLGQNGLLSAPSSLPFLPQSPPSSVIFPNHLASIAATANALDPLAALMKHRKGKLSSVSLFESKPSPEEPFFKHKCRFCAKVFGSDSALQIHLRSHTGERPFKCNICGNRFSTKGNLKVHFQRHKEKYPHIQMNPYPVPEYLDNVPTTSGIPYGMTVPPEKPVTSWMESKPSLATLPVSLGLPLSSTITSIGGSSDLVSVTPSDKSSYQPSTGECASLSPDRRGSEAHLSPVSQSSPETDASTLLKTDGAHLPRSCPTRPRSTPLTNTSSATIPTLAATPEPASPVPKSSPGLLTSDGTQSPSGGLLESMQTSETSKLQQLVENIDKKITDPNQCVLCHRVLSCQSALKMHYRIHTGERPFKCKVCGRAFTTKGNLKTHVGVHRENPPVQVQHSCPICQKKFTNAVVLQQHIRLHMVGHIPDSTLVDGVQDMDSDVSVNGTNFDSLSSNGNDFTDDISMEDDIEEEEVEEILKDDETPPNLLIPDCNSPPKAFSIVSSLAALENQMRMIDSGHSLNHSFGVKPLTNGLIDSSSVNIRCAVTENSPSIVPNVSESSSLPHASTSPIQSISDNMTIKSPEVKVSRPDSGERLVATVKKEESESPTSASFPSTFQDLRGAELIKHGVKEESPYNLSFLPSRDRGQTIPSLATNTSPAVVKTEVNGLSEGHQPPFTVHIPAAYPLVSSPAVTSLLGPAPPRRTPKQHNCSACGKNFSSASALQIHERTHTGEKPFVCSICGRAFTTKGNLKVHMGTHMWNNAPARRGRRLSVDNPMALLGGEAAKFGEMFQKDLAARAMNVDAGFWNRYATAITNSLAMKSNEISVIQNRGISQLHPLTAGMDRVSAAGNSIPSLTKTGMDRHFSLLIDDSKDIGIN